MLGKRMIFIAMALLSYLPLSAARAFPFPVTVTQPDGSSIQILLHGDESFSYRTDLEGNILTLDSDGFYRTGGTLPKRPLEMKSLFPDGGLLSAYVKTKSVLNYNTIVIPVQFSDLKFTRPDIRSGIDRLFNEWNYTDDGATGSVHDYFRDNLGSFCNMNFQVCKVVTLPYGYAHYGANSGGVTDKNIKQLVLHACNAAHENGVDFSKFDFNNDGYVDNVFIIFAGHNEAEGADENHIWPQSWNVADQQIYFDGVRVSNFSTYSEYRGAYGYNFAGIGTICHEYCHILGLTDLYDVNDDIEGRSKGAGGSLSIMDLGNYNNDGLTPPYLTLFERQTLGLVSERVVSQGTDLSVVPLQDAKTVYQLACDTYGEKYWIEYHNGDKWDKFSGGQGLVLFHIDRSENMAGSMTAKMRWQQNAVNGCESHPCAVPVSVTGEQYGAKSGLFFPGSDNVTAIHSSVNFALRSWNGDGIGVGLSEIRQGPDGMEMKVISDDAWNLPQLLGYSVIPDQTSALLEWEYSKEGPGCWELAWGSSSNPQINRCEVSGTNRYRFNDLIPGDNYFCVINFRNGNIVGKRNTIEFRTVERLSSFPLIGGADRSYSSGESVRLTVLNLTEDYVKIMWSVNHQVIVDEQYTFQSAGSYLIEADITYSDGSVETLTKLFKVK